MAKQGGKETERRDAGENVDETDQEELNDDYYDQDQ